MGPLLRMRALSRLILSDASQLQEGRQAIAVRAAVPPLRCDDVIWLAWH